MPCPLEYNNVAEDSEKLYNYRTAQTTGMLIITNVI